ncbi:phenylalanine--tRNA ligase subunit beta, partial [Rhizobium leguminosarum]|nr:phenylalanine--tRNA ligase subunit beta [Rhizobium leguminosarum]
GVDWEVADEAAERAVQMLVELAGGTAEPGVTDVGTRPEPAVVEMAADFPSALVGVAYTTDEVVETLRALGAEVAVTEAADGAAPRLTVTAPSWRTDLRIPEDLAEEVARLRGYDAIPSVVPVAPPGRGFTRRQAQRRRVSAALAAAGLTEVLAYPFVS